MEMTNYINKNQAKTTQKDTNCINDWSG